MKKRLCCVAALVIGGCGGSMAPAAETAESAEYAGGDSMGADSVAESGAMNDDWTTLMEMDAQFDETLEMAEVDCDSARDLAGSICELAGRVCEIAEDTADATTVERCDDGRARCERAQDRTSNVCP